MPAPLRTTRLTYDDLLALPEDNTRRELFGGDLVVTPAPTPRHQEAVLEIGAAFLAWVKQHGGKVFASPVDVVLTEVDVVEPDVTFVRPERAGIVGERALAGAPDLAVEVSSPSTRRRDLGAKRDLYERHGVGEFWFVDLDAGRVEVYRRGEGGYRTPHLVGRGEVLTSPLVPGLAIPVDDVVGPPPADG